MAEKRKRDRSYAPRACPVCGTVFKPRSVTHKYDTEACKGKAKYLDGVVTTESQYLKISGNWYRYFQRLSSQKDRGRNGVTAEFLVDLLAQQEGRCAVSGAELTCALAAGQINPTNASIDRIRPGEPYTPDNVQLVCRIVNIMKWDQTEDELREWCKRIIAHGGT